MKIKKCPATIYLKKSEKKEIDEKHKCAYKTNLHYFVFFCDLRYLNFWPQILLNMF